MEKPGSPFYSGAGLLLLVLLVGCSQASAPTGSGQVLPPWIGEPPKAVPTSTPTVQPTMDPLMALFPTSPAEGESRPSPTPDPVREPPTFRTESDFYIVQPGDSLAAIAWRYGVGVEQLMTANGIYNPNYLAVGQYLLVPASEPLPTGPKVKLIPDAELIYGPSTAFFDAKAESEAWGGKLATYREEVDGERMSGGEIVELVARRYSVNPRVLLTLLEYQGGWLTQAEVPLEAALYPLGYVDPQYEGLFSQLSWAADQLNTGFYRWRAGWQGPYIFPDGKVAPPGPGLNAGTVGLQYLFSKLYFYTEWEHAVGEDGFIAVYQTYFGDPFQWAVEPLVPAELEQPLMQLPFEDGATWSFTSGPHGAWGEGSAWAGLDFAPPGYALGCVLSNAWVTAVADGPVLRTDEGLVVQSLDDDLHEGTGWVVVYLHVESRDRVEAGVELQAGDRIGHPSCEGGVSSGTHLHITRKYNGVWIEADGDLPFVMDGWVSAGTGREYDGTLTRNGVTLEACSCRAEGNQISR
ncbi:MAG: LysM peptidoglycan-binding domain-containing protein [Anaerolineales bacterium]